VSHLTGNAVDGSADIPCDFSSDFEPEAGKSTRDKEITPIKHPAFKDKDDVAYLCDNCLGVICRDCRVEYSSEEEETPTPTKVTFPEFRQNSSSSGTDSKDSNKKDSSLLDDYADTSTEMPDYMGGDD
jgi:hypothetical protein